MTSFQRFFIILVVFSGFILMATEKGFTECRIYLKNGNVIKSEYCREEGNEIKYLKWGGTIGLSKDIIKNVEFNTSRSSKKKSHVSEEPASANHASSSDTGEIIKQSESAQSKLLPEGVAPVTIKGRITNKAGKPIARVQVLSWGLKDKKNGFKGMKTTQTDANGNYRLDIDSRFLWVIYHHGPDRREFSKKGPWKSNATVNFVVPAD